MDSSSTLLCEQHSDSHSLAWHFESLSPPSPQKSPVSVQKKAWLLDCSQQEQPLQSDYHHSPGRTQQQPHLIRRHYYDGLESSNSPTQLQLPPPLPLPKNLEVLSIDYDGDLVAEISTAADAGHYDSKVDYVWHINSLLDETNQHHPPRIQKANKPGRASELSIPQDHRVPVMSLPPHTDEHEQAASDALDADNDRDIGLAPSGLLIGAGSPVVALDILSPSHIDRDTASSSSSSIPTPRDLVSSTKRDDRFATAHPEPSIHQEVPMPRPASHCSIASGYVSDDDMEDNQSTFSRCSSSSSSTDILNDSLTATVRQAPQYGGSNRRNGNTDKKGKKRKQEERAAQSRSKKKSKQENPNRRTHNYAQNHCGFVEDPTRPWTTLPGVSCLPGFDAEITCRTRMDKPIHSIPDRLYSNMKYEFRISAVGVPKQAVIARLSILRADTFIPVAETKGVPVLKSESTTCCLFMDVNAAKSSSTCSDSPNKGGVAHGTITAQCNTQYNWHTGRPRFCWLLSFHLNDDLDHVVLYKRSPSFAVFARKPTSKRTSTTDPDPKTAQNSNRDCDTTDDEADDDDAGSNEEQDTAAPHSDPAPPPPACKALPSAPPANPRADSEIFQNKLAEFVAWIAGCPADKRKEFAAVAMSRLSRLDPSVGAPPAAAAREDDCPSPTSDFLCSPL